MQENPYPSIDEFEDWYNIPDQYDDGYPVLRTTESVPDFGFQELIPPATPFCLVGWLPPADYRGPLAIIEQATGKQHTFEIRSEDILRAEPEEGGSDGGQFA